MTVGSRTAGIRITSRQGDTKSETFCCPNKKPREREAFEIVTIRTGGYLILPSLNSTCLRNTGSYFFTENFSVMVRVFFFVT